ncbi:MAG: bifunctional demethylmenaquinone methyltransferase/2-methoxy-6-polyprenyl-1,4-benzoquinol methylase UbiE [Thermodesulfobacteriota bacterium]
MSIARMESAFIQSMFDAIAPHYDFLNRLLSLRQDVYWRREMVRALDLGERPAVLDVACGTGDVVVEVMDKRPGSVVYGIDFSAEMLTIARQKTATQLHPTPPHLLTADALALPFAPAAFDAVTIAFGIRNIKNRDAALAEFQKVLKPGGKLAVLELNTPPAGRLRQLYLLYFQKLLPAVGGLFSRNVRAYRYLPASVVNFPPPQWFAGRIRAAGFACVAWKPLTAGIATLYLGEKGRTDTCEYRTNQPPRPKESP